MSKIIDPKKAPYCDVGGYNDPPSPLTERPIGEFWHQLFFQTVIHQESRQCWFTPEQREKRSIHGCQIFWFHNVGYLLMPEGRSISNPDTENGLPYQLPVMKCYRIGCVHEYVESNPQMFLNIYKCSKCGHSYSTDSSD